MNRLSLTDITIGQIVWLHHARSGHLYRAHIEGEHHVEGLDVFMTNGGWRGRLYGAPNGDGLCIQAQSGTVLTGVSIRRIER